MSTVITPTAIDTGSDLDLELSRLRLETPVDPLYRIALLGNFRGHAESDLPLARRRPAVIDKDSFDAVLARMAPAVTVPVGDETVRLTFRSLQQMHPDLIWELCPAFAEWRAAVSDLTVRPPAEAAARMREILHNPDFQALEASWRALQLLVNRTEVSPLLRLELLDVGHSELVADLLEDRDLEDTALYQKLVESGPYCLVMADYQFSANIEDLALLHRLGALGARGKTPVVTCAGPSVDAWLTDLPAAWQEFRSTKPAQWVGLCVPRFLTRLPYGHPANRCVLFPFEEQAEANHRCWANPSWISTLILVSQCLRMMEGERGKVPLLPEADGTECVEAALDENAALELAARGLIPFASRDEGGAMEMIHLQSAARTPLRGPWMGAQEG